jgi:hypothetical protein
MQHVNSLPFTACQKGDGHIGFTGDKPVTGGEVIRWRSNNVWLGSESRRRHNQSLRSRQTYEVKLYLRAMNKRDFSADKQLLRKLRIVF